MDDYSGYSSYGYSTEIERRSDGAMTMDEPDGSGAEHPDLRFDILSFFATAYNDSIDEKERRTTLVFFSIHLGPWNMFLPQKIYSGATFSVTLLSRKFLIRNTAIDLDYINPVRRLLAVKTPKLRPDAESSYNSKLLRSLAKEYQILKSERLAEHENIVTAYGCCWQTLPTGQSQPIPALILEGTTLGDLASFSSSRLLTLRDRFKLCMDVTSGLEALHIHGVIHGDLKPKNILVFSPRRRGYNAKLADFGDAILLSETTLPCRAPPGTKVYRAPECADASARLGRDDLIKSDLFSLGVTLAFLLVGSHIADDIMALSDSILQRLKEENQFAAWIVAHRHDNSTHIVAPTGSSGWVTDESWNESSLFSDDELSRWFMRLCNRLLAADIRKRAETVMEPAIVLRHMLRRHLQTLPARRSERKAASETDRFASKPASWAKMAALMNISKARLRKLTGQRIPSKSRISRKETLAIAHCCDQPGDYLKEARFIIERNEDKRFKLKKTHLKKWHIKSAFSCPRSKRASIPAGVVCLASRMADGVERSLDNEVQQLMDLRIVSLQKTMFKVGNLFWLLPHPVRELLESQLLRNATDPQNTDADRADAAFEYAIMILNANDPVEARIDSALELLTFAARNGLVGAQASVGRLSDVFGRPLTVTRDEEMEWLLAASRAGSTTAQRRFRTLDMEAFTSAMRDIRQENGTTCPWLSQALLAHSRWVRQTGNQTQTIYSDLHDAAITGNVELLLKIPPELSSDLYECRNMLGETPLVVACREGRASVVEWLLARGANAAHETAHCVTPLHFLAAFEDNNIPKVASALLQHGADVDKFCKRERAYRELFDSPFGQVGGTPLLWAVETGNYCAVKTLLACGADPFAMEPTRPMLSRDAYGESPITRAAFLHRPDLLEILIGASGGNKGFRERLIAECDGPYSQGYQALCQALDCHPSFRVREYILHGKEYKTKALACVSFLVEAGVDPTRFIKSFRTGRRSEIAHPILAACMSGDTSILRYLWGYRNGILRPTLKLWTTALSHAVFERLRESFDFLIDSRDDITADVGSDVAAIAKTLTLTNDPYFTVGVLRLIQRPGVLLTPAGAFHIFLTAVNLDHFEVARRVQRAHSVSLTHRVGGGTLLYNLMGESNNFPNMERRISFIMSLSPDRDRLFWNVGYLENTGMSALQFAALLPIQRFSASPGVFVTILEHFSEPNYLNAQLSRHATGESAGYTALHLAVRSGNIDAVAKLVETPGIETNLRSSRGETPIDICVDMAQQYETEEQTRFPTDAAQRNQSAVNMSILDLLLNAENEGRIAKYSTLFLRRTEDEFTLVDATRGKLHGVMLRDLVEAGPELSGTSRCIVEEAPIGGIAAFSSDTLVLPGDLNTCIDTYWQARRK